MNLPKRAVQNIQFGDREFELSVDQDSITAKPLCSGCGEALFDIDAWVFVRSGEGKAARSIEQMRQQLDKKLRKLVQAPEAKCNRCAGPCVDVGDLLNGWDSATAI